ncbi:MAG: nodulation protein NfeD [Veillonellaceae bacterium]|jgi:membrane-bound serine protease (ClpP class)|nr:nodulation protein NfeD [Veillonellaceae bacterium]
MRSMKALLVLFLIAIAMLWHPAAEAAPVVIVNIKGEINGGQTALIQRALNDANTMGAQFILVELDTFGGQVDAAVKIRDMISETPLNTICYIKNRAWSAGALIAIAHRQIAIAPGGSIGAAEPIPATEKNIAALRAEFAATANKTGRNAQIAEAMVDKTLGFVGVAEPGKIVALTDYQAASLGYADVVAPDRASVLAHYGLAGNELLEYTPSWRDTFSGWLSEEATKSLLITIIILAILTEIKTAGTGVAALVGLVAAGLFFISQWWVGFAGWVELALFFGGLLLLLVELYTPGVGIFGVSGLAAILLSFFLVLGASTAALSLLATSLVIAVLIFLLILKRLPSSKLWTKLVLKDSATDAEGFVSSDDYKAYTDREGIAITPLRPAGIMAIDGKQLNVVSEGQFIPQGTKLKVVNTSGNRIVVRPAEN